jgi:DNA repair protein RadA/Sms
MIVAVLDKHAEVKLGKHDVLVNVAGGLRVQEPAADLGLALAIASSFKERSLPEGTVVIGELGLAGEVRRVGRMERRLQEAARRGFTSAIVPRGAAGAARGLDVRCLEVAEVREAVALCR